MPYIMGIDQGGTKTDIVVAGHDGRIIGFGDDRDWTPVAGERRQVRMTRVRYAAEKALKDAGLALSDIDSVSASCCGADWEFEYGIGRRNLRNTLGVQKVELYNDCIGALRGGTEMRGRDCAVICLGSGANCALHSKEGKEYIYAYYLKDIHQGAGAIGRFVFQAVFDAEAGLGPQTILTDLLLEETGYGGVDELLMAITTGRTENEPKWLPAYKEYGPLLFRAVAMGDAVAAEYLDWLCRDLTRYVTIGARRLAMEDRSFDLVLSGGVPKGGAVMLELLQKHVRDALPAVRCLEARFEPVVGALLLGLDEIYPGGIPRPAMERLEEGCRERRLFRPAPAVSRKQIEIIHI